MHLIYKIPNSITQKLQIHKKNIIYIINIMRPLSFTAPIQKLFKIGPDFF